MSVGLGVFEFGGGGVVLLEVGVICTAGSFLELILFRFEVTLPLLLVGRLLSTLELLMLTIIMLIVRTASVVIIRPFRTMEVPLALGDGSGG